ncbi:hypothetical protein Pelo_10307 [Pelomyxa schiedti]|nr:hypothetical protein Pelo_10307 [Pelomyxa schiedti]
MASGASANTLPNGCPPPPTPTSTATHQVSSPTTTATTSTSTFATTSTSTSTNTSHTNLGSNGGVGTSATSTSGIVGGGCSAQGDGGLSGTQLLGHYKELGYKLKDSIRANGDESLVRTLVDLDNALKRAAASAFLVAIMGMIKAGKSTLINSIIGKSLLPMGNAPVTKRVFQVRHLPINSSLLISSNGYATSDQDISTQLHHLNEASCVDVPTLHTPFSCLKPLSDTLPSSFVLLDMPGCEESHASPEMQALIKKSIQDASAIIYLLNYTFLNSTGEGDVIKSLKSERELLTQSRDRLFFVVNKMKSAKQRAPGDMDERETQRYVSRLLKRDASLDVPEEAIICINSLEALRARMFLSNFGTLQDFHNFLYPHWDPDEELLPESRLRRDATRMEKSSNIPLLEEKILLRLHYNGLSITLSALSERMLNTALSFSNYLTTSLASLKASEVDLATKMKTVTESITTARNQFSTVLNELCALPEIDIFLSFDDIIYKFHDGIDSLAKAKDYEVMVARGDEATEIARSFNKAVRQSISDMVDEYEDGCLKALKGSMEEKERSITAKLSQFLQQLKEIVQNSVAPNEILFPIVVDRLQLPELYKFDVAPGDCLQPTTPLAQSVVGRVINYVPGEKLKTWLRKWTFEHCDSKINLDDSKVLWTSVLTAVLEQVKRRMKTSAAEQQRVRQIAAQDILSKYCDMYINAQEKALQSHKRGSEDVSAQIIRLEAQLEQTKSIIHQLRIGATGNLSDICRIVQQFPHSSCQIQRDYQLEDSCAVCLDRQSNCQFIPCGHQCCCIQCAAGIMAISPSCPLCRGSIAHIREINHASFTDTEDS